MTKNDARLHAALQLRRIQKQLQLAHLKLIEGHPLAAADIIVMAKANVDGLLAHAGEQPDPAEPAPKDVGDDLQERFNAVLARVQEDRAEIVPSEKPTQSPGVIVMRHIDVLKLSQHRRDVVKSLHAIHALPVPQVLAPDIQDAITRFKFLMPHAVQVFIRALGAQQSGEPVHIQPLLLVGDPGSGKTTVARMICDILAVPHETHNMAGMADSSIMGTSAQYASVRPHVATQLMARTRTANPVLIWDEIEKAGSGRHNGNPLEAILPLLEGHTAQRYRDPAVEVEIDLSHVSHIATANSLEGLPAPLLDRLTIVKMPEPSWEHIGALSRSILDKLARERGLDPRWFPDLDGSELEALKTVWSGGSIRRLEKAIRAYVARRDQLLPRA